MNYLQTEYAHKTKNDLKRLIQQSQYKYYTPDASFRCAIWCYSNEIDGFIYLCDVPIYEQCPALRKCISKNWYIYMYTTVMIFWQFAHGHHVAYHYLFFFATKTSNILSLKVYIGQCLHLFQSKSGFAGVIGKNNCGLCPLVKAYFSSSILFYSRRNSVNNNDYAGYCSFAVKTCYTCLFSEY